MIAFDENYVAEPWHTFLVYQGLNLVVLLYNIFLLHRTLWIHNLACKSTFHLRKPDSGWYHHDRS